MLFGESKGNATGALATALHAIAGVPVSSPPIHRFFFYPGTATLVRHFVFHM